jgi:hypothetical protein
VCHSHGHGGTVTHPRAQAAEIPEDHGWAEQSGRTSEAGEKFTKPWPGTRNPPVNMSFRSLVFKAPVRQLISRVRDLALNILSAICSTVLTFNKDAAANIIGA